MYLLLYREKRHLFSFYINSAKKKVVIGGAEGDILFPPELQGHELTLRREFDFKGRQYYWALYPSSKSFLVDGKEVKPGDPFPLERSVSIRDFSFSFSEFSHHGPATGEPHQPAGGTMVIDTGKMLYKSVVIEQEGVEKSFVYREGREIRIGRKKADITVTHPAVSSEHLLLVMRESGITFWNKGKNGTYINGLRVESGELQEGKYRLLLAGKQPVSVSVVRERAAESFYKGSLSPLFEQVEGWLQKTELFGSHPIILFTGESGVGKEVFADFAHGMSGRKGEFVTYNAAAIPETLVESELFGTCKGSFTGAEERSGAFLRANGGTLFLDEIAEMPLSLQSKLLRVTEDWTIRRIGETGAGKRVDVMLVLATNRDLEQEVAAGRFRKDLFYRLSTLSLNIPPLRQRRGDIVPLARHLLFSLIGRELPISDDAAAALSAAEWPGNVRELKSMMTRFAYTGKERVDLSAIK